MNCNFVRILHIPVITTNYPYKLDYKVKKWICNVFVKYQRLIFQQAYKITEI